MPFATRSGPVMSKTQGKSEWGHPVTDVGQTISDANDGIAMRDTEAGDADADHAFGKITGGGG